MTPFDRLRAKHFAMRANPELARDVRRVIRQAFRDGIRYEKIWTARPLSHTCTEDSEQLFFKYWTPKPEKAAMKAKPKTRTARREHRAGAGDAISGEATDGSRSKA